MNLTQPFSRRTSDLPNLAQRLLLIAATALATLAAAVILFTLGVRVAYAGRALPGVQVAGLDASGMRPAEIELALGAALTYPQNGTIVLRDGDRQWVARPAEVGVIIDIPEMVRRAVALGRTGGLLSRIADQYEAWYEGARIPPIVIFDQRAAGEYLARIAAEIDRPEVDARLRVEGTEVIVEPGQIGRWLDPVATLESLIPIVSQLHDGNISLVIVETPPRVLDASEQGEIARRFLDAPLSLTAEGMEPLILAPARLAEMIQFRLVEGEEGAPARYEVGLEPQQLAALLEPLAPELERQPQNARFIFNDDTRQLDLLQPAVIGRSLNVNASIEAIQEAAGAGRHEAPLVFNLAEPSVGDDATGADLGITENVVAVSTYFAGSSPERMQNIATAAGAFHGLLIAPGETLSMAEVLGDISLDKGYAEALIIFGNRTIKGVGGGVCQVSTTLYRAAFFGGYPIVERHSHAYRVLYYEQGPNSPGPGMDATVFVPLVDFKFTNDTPYWLLLETYIYGTQLLWKFYSTSDGRTVQWNSSGATNVVEAPEPLYRENPDLPEGEIDQVDFEADGMDIVVTRTVVRDGQVIYDDIFKTHYLPWRAIYEYGPGTELPKDAKTE